MNARHPTDDPNRIPGREEEGPDEPLPGGEDEPWQAPGPERAPGHPPTDPGEPPNPVPGQEPLEVPGPDAPIAEVREHQEDQLDQAMDDSFPASDPPAFVGSGGTDRPRFPDPSLVPVHRDELEADFPADVELDDPEDLDDLDGPGVDDLDDDLDDDLFDDDDEEDDDGEDDDDWEVEEDDLEPGSGEDRYRLAADPKDDRARGKPPTDDLAAHDDNARRGPFRPGNPSAAAQEGFVENAEGEALDPVFREATSEVDVYEDLPSRRARVGPDDEVQDEDTLIQS
jgi:hypothetical protein